VPYLTPFATAEDLSILNFKNVNNE
jgi:hypothetical protein